MDSLLDYGIVPRSIHKLLAIDQCAVVCGQQLCHSGNLAEVRPVIRRVQVRDDTVDEASLKCFLRADWLV